MASTRNRNSPGDYSLEQSQKSNVAGYFMYENSGHPETSNFAGNGLLMGRMASTNLSTNSVDIESFLYGIGTSNLVNPFKPITPEIKQLNSLNVIDRLPIHIPSEIKITPNQRPSFT